MTTRRPPDPMPIGTARPSPANPPETPVTSTTAGEPVPAGPAPKLRPCQLAVLRFIANGASNAQAAHALGLSERTVEAYLADTSARLGTRGRAHAVAVALKLGLLDAGEIVLPAAVEGRTGAQGSQESHPGPHGAPGPAGGPR